MEELEILETYLKLEEDSNKMIQDYIVFFDKLSNEVNGQICDELMINFIKNKIYEFFKKYYIVDRLNFGLYLQDKILKVIPLNLFTMLLFEAIETDQKENQNGNQNGKGN